VLLLINTHASANFSFVLELGSWKDRSLLSKKRKKERLEPISFFGRKTIMDCDSSKNIVLFFPPNK